MRAMASRARSPQDHRAVALTETGKKQDGRLRAWPWAINREGKGYWFENYEQALAFAREHLPAPVLVYATGGGAIERK